MGTSGFNSLWMHSGLDWLGTPQSAFALQEEYLERRTGRRLNTQEFDLRAGRMPDRQPGDY